MNKVLDSAKFVASNSKYVAIDSEKIDEFIKRIKPCHIKHWWNEAPFDLKKLKTNDKLMFLLVFNSISFSYWGNPKWTIKYKKRKIDGSFGMIAALGRAYENDSKILFSNHLAQISKKDFARVLKANTEIPLLAARLKIIRDVASVLEQKYEGNFKNLLKKAEGDALKLLNLLVNNFPSFKDAGIYKGRKIYFYKRAQLLVGDILQTFRGEDMGNLKNIQAITACADYKLPMVLRRFGILKYAQKLTEKIDSQVPLVHGSTEEIEIRANTIWAVELIKQRLKRKIPGINSIQINDHLWLLSQHKVKNEKPYHLTRTTAY